jgi:hypothetical protein
LFPSGRAKDSSAVEELMENLGCKLCITDRIVRNKLRQLADMMEIFTVLVSNTKLKYFYKILDSFIGTYFLNMKL